MIFLEVTPQGYAAACVFRSSKVEHLTEAVRSADAKYELTAHISVALDHRYLDFTNVKRH